MQTQNSRSEVVGAGKQESVGSNGHYNTHPLSVEQVQQAIAASQSHILSQQYDEGYWWAELESNVTITAEVLLLHKIWGTDTSRSLHKVEQYLRREQKEHGGWELFYSDGGEHYHNHRRCCNFATID